LFASAARSFLWFNNLCRTAPL
jgi:hypothetical protein